MAPSGLAVRSVAWASLEAGTSVLLSFCTLLLLARMLGPFAYGVAASTLGIVQILNLFVEALFGEALVQRSDLRQEHIDTAFWTALAVASVVVALCWAGGAAEFARLYGVPMLAPLLSTAVIGLPFAAYTGVQSAVMRRSFGFRRLAMRTLLARLSGTVIGLGSAAAGWGAWSIIFQYLASTILGAAALCWWAPEAIGGRVRPARLRELLVFVVPWISNEALQVNLPRLFQLMAAYLIGMADFGFLSIGFRISDTLRDVIGHVASNVGLPMFTRARHSPAGLTEHFSAATSTLCLVAMPAFLGLAAGAHAVVLVVLGKSWLSAVPAVQAVAVAGALGMATTFCYTVFSAVGRPGLALPCSLADLVVSAFLLLAVAQGGTAAVASAWVARQAVSTVIVCGVCLAVLSARPSVLLRATGVPAAIAAGIGLLIWATDRNVLPHAAPVVRLAMLMLVGAVSLCAAAAATRPDLVTSVLQRFGGPSSGLYREGTSAGRRVRPAFFLGRRNGG